MNAIRVGIIGVSGYTGLELVKMIIKHPVFELSYLANSEGESTIEELHPSLVGVCNLHVEKADAKVASSRCDLVFLALPHKTAMAFVAPLMENGTKVVDLSADYRLKLDTYEMFYTRHTDIANLINNSVYGLPELYRSKLKSAKLVANPGCFPTSALLGILPFMKYRHSFTPIIIDAKTGVSGAGKKLSQNTHFVHVNDNLFAYSPLSHRHAPEIAEKLGVVISEVCFVPHLCPLTRGMLSSIYIQVEGEFDPIEVAREFYKEEPFVRVLNQPVDMKNVAGTNFCDIYAKKQGSTLFISSAIDNLQRGASSQAIVNANLMMGLEETLGVPNIAYVP